MNIKTVALPIGKASELKVYLPVINALRNRQLTVVLLCGPNPTNLYPKNTESNPTKANLGLAEDSRLKIIYYQNAKDFERLLSKLAVSSLISINNPSAHTTLGAIAARLKLRLYYLQSYFDFIYMPPESLQPVTNFFVYSPAMITFYYQAHPDTPTSLLAKFIPVGNPSLDTLNQLPSLAKIKTHYHLPANRRLILLLTTNPHINFWTKYIFAARSRPRAIYHCLKHRRPSLLKSALKDTSYRQLLRSLRNWADTHQALIIAKTKLKHKDPSFLHDYIDLFLNDNPRQPNLTLELLKIADLVVSFEYSSSVLEAAVENVYSLQIITNNPVNTTAPPETNIIKTSDIFNQSVCRLINQNKFSRFLHQHSLDDLILTPDHVAPYLKKYLGELDGQAAARLVDHILKNM